MLITFKSRADGDVIMFGESGQHMLRLMGKDAQDARGIITVEQLAAAIAALQAAVNEDKARQASAAKAPEEDEDPWEAADKTRAAANTVSLAQRAAPLIDLLSLSLRDKTPVIWES